MDFNTLRKEYSKFISDPRKKAMVTGIFQDYEESLFNGGLISCGWNGAGYPLNVLTNCPSRLEKRRFENQNCRSRYNNCRACTGKHRIQFSADTWRR